jgi:hypothetical protein
LPVAARLSGFADVAGFPAVVVWEFPAGVFGLSGALLPVFCAS